MRLKNRCNAAAIATLLSIALTACSSTPVRVAIEPEGVEMSQVLVGDKSAKYVADEGLYRVGIEAPEKEPAQYRITGTSADGVPARPTTIVVPVGGGEPRATLVVPAAVRINVASGQPREVRVDGELVPNETLGELWIIETSQPEKELAIQGVGANGFQDSTQVTVRPGYVTNAQLSFEIGARLTADSTAILYGDEVEFDASGSSPGDEITGYTWYLGDGSAPKTTVEPTLAHRFDYRDGWGDEESFDVRVEVTAQGQKQRSTPLRISAKRDRTALVAGLEVYPQRAELHVMGSEIQFRVLPKGGYAPQEVLGLQFDFGDGTLVDKDVYGEPLQLRLRDGQPEPLLISHAYQAAGNFEPRLLYQHRPQTGLQGPFAADFTPNSDERLSLRISGEYLTEKELNEKAWAKVAGSLAELLKAQGGSPKVVLSSLDDANFETSESSEFGGHLDLLTKHLVSEGQTVLERSTPVLARLAPEAAREMHAGVEDPEPKGSVDYGIVSGSTNLRGVEYAIRLEGFSDRYIEQSLSEGENKQSASAKGEDVSVLTANMSTGDGADAEIEEGLSLKERDAVEKWARKNLPVLLARFDAADIIIAFRVVEERNWMEPNIAYNAELDEPMALQVARVSLDVRCISSEGQILIADRLSGQYEQRVPESRLP